MICESGRVVSIEDEWMWVETHQLSSCQSCSAKSGCGQSLINSVFSGKRHYVKVAANGISEAVHLHDQVEIAIPDHAMLFGSFWLYLLPLLTLIAGALLGNHLAGGVGDLYAIIGAVIGFLVAACFIRLHSFLQRDNPAYHPVLHPVLHRVIHSAEAKPQIVSVNYDA
jgi:sigma-E factor negative regulatory protein RseC